MEYVIKKDIISILRKALHLLKKDEIAALDELSNHTIHNASIFQDEDSILLAVVVYSLAKIVHRSESNPEFWKKICKKIEADLEEARFFLEEDNEESYKRVVTNMLKNIGEVDDKLKLYVEDVFKKAKIVKGSKLYEHGVSIERSAELLGISQWELMSYIGKTRIVDKYEERVISVDSRVNYTKKIFEV